MGVSNSWDPLRWCPTSLQIDGSTLRTLCLQHGPLITFHLNLTQGNAVVRYSSKDEAAKAQKSLHMYVHASPGYHLFILLFGVGEDIQSGAGEPWVMPGTVQEPLSWPSGCTRSCSPHCKVPFLHFLPA